jgi:class 3 adenylate cyclase
VELPGEDHLPFVGDQDAMLDEIERFIIEAPMLAPFDRVLSTIVHAEIDGSQGVPAFLEHATRECEWFRGRVIQSNESRFVAGFDGPARAIRCASALSGAAGRFHVGVRIGMHTGECTVEAGLPAGPPVQVASAIAAAARRGEVLVSRTVRDILGDAGLPFEDRGVHTLGPAAEWKLFSV